MPPRMLAHTKAAYRSGRILQVLDSSKGMPSRMGPGTTLSAATETRARHVRRAVLLLQRGLEEQAIAKSFKSQFGPRWQSSIQVDQDIPSRAAWALITSRIVGRLTGGLDCTASLQDTEAWFLGPLAGHVDSLAGQVSPSTDKSVCEEMERIRFDQELSDLLPYVLEIHGPGSRASVMRDPSTRVARDTKRTKGVFYTPPDVAKYMARVALNGPSFRNKGSRCLDPACGTGVFLRAVLNDSSVKPTEAFRFALDSLFGIDISPHAIESTCFVLLHDLLQRCKPMQVDPWSVWHALRLNFAVADSTELVSPSGGQLRSADVRKAVQQELIQGKALPAAEGGPDTLNLDRGSSLFGGTRRLDGLFPDVFEGFDVLICNPPYAQIARKGSVDSSFPEYECLRSGVGPSGNLYPLFIEMTWRFTRPTHSSSALVVPLSIAYHRGRQFVECREAMVRNGGAWKFAFFDREPHALFGEDVKTRNAIIFRSERAGDKPRGSSSAVYSGPLRRWTSRTRQELFESIEFTRLPTSDIGDGIPKIGGEEQTRTLGVLRGLSQRLRTSWVTVGSCLPEETFCEQFEPVVYVAGTAYNFLNVFRPQATRICGDRVMSQSRVARLQFSDENDAATAFAILSSRFVFWMWHVYGDGFHVPRWFLEGIPFDRTSFTPQQRRQLSGLGTALWEELQNHTVVSVNGGRTTIAYRPLACDSIRAKIDRVLIEAAGVDISFQEHLGRFIRDVVVVDEADERRASLWPGLSRQEAAT